MLLLGHRGSWGLHPENTMPAFQAALDSGLDGIEFDVQPTLDGQLVVRHDESLPSGEPVSSLTLEQLRRAEPELPTLDQVLTWWMAKGCWLNLELKNDRSRWDARERLLLEALDRAGPSAAQLRRLVISSFSPVSLHRLYWQDHGLQLGLLYWAETPAWLPALARWAPLYSLHPNYRLIRPSWLREVQRQGLSVLAWTVNDPVAAARLAGWGVDGLIGDLPAALLEAPARLGRAG
jgi:glycerophosphoryl diester phosphodiesterase